MIYMLVSLLNLFLINFKFSQDNKTGNLFLSFFLMLGLSILPALQYDVGTDYQSYTSIYFDPDGLEIFRENNEYIFFLLIKLLKYFDLSPQYFFIASSLMMSTIFIQILDNLKKHNFDCGLIFLIYIVATGMTQNQMNLIRNYLAIYLFILAVTYKFDGEWIKVTACSLLGILSHQTYLLVLPFLLLPTALYIYLVEKIIRNYLIILAIVLSGIFSLLLEYVVEWAIPSYGFYLAGDVSGADIMDILVKIIYLPIFIYFFICIYPNKRVKFLRFDLALLGLWVATSSIVFLIAQIDYFYRLYIYVQFFSIFPIYYSIKFTKNFHVKFLLLIYIITPYLYKILLYAQHEYDYKSILFIN